MCRCFVMACRVTPVPSLSCVIDSGPLAHSLATNVRRVVSPRAAKTGAASLNLAAELRPRDMTFDVFELLRPAALVPFESVGAALQRNASKARFDDCKQSAFRLVFQPELDQRHRFLRVILVGINGMRMPAIRKVMLGVNPLNHHLHGHA